DPAEDFTITCWVHSNDLSANSRFIDKRSGTDAGYELISTSGSGMLWAEVDNTVNQIVSPAAGSIIISDGNWHHVAYVLNKTDKTSKTYVDGVLDQSFSHVLISVYGSANSENLHFGSDINNTIYYNGDLDEIRFWSSALTAGEVVTDMNTASLIGNELNLIASWDFENATGNSVPDISGNGHTGTLMNGAYTFDPATDQTIVFDPISYKYTSDAPFNVHAEASTLLPITYTIVSGPATVIDSTITLTGISDTVVVKAEQLGNGTFNPVSTTQSFYVLDLNTIYPVVTTKHTDAYPIEMPTLNAYPLYASSTIDEPNQLIITSIEFEVNGTPITTTQENGYYFAWWTPATIGNYDIYTKATASNGNITTDTVNVDVVNTASTQNVQTFDGDLVAFGVAGANRTFYGDYTLPQSIGAYDQIIANFSVTCPSISGACDDWDRLAYVEYKAPDGTWMELFRYITPYGVACNHSIDVTDYASLLHGNVELRMFIDTWGTGGWDIHLDLDYVAGTPTYLYSDIKEVWHGSYNFGNPTNLQPCDTVTIDFMPNVQKATFRLTTTGHGWGNNNSNNAAEFYNATHNFHINGTSTYSQYLWNTCNPNPDNCTGQAGTWQYNRAGWCPGAIAPPHTYDLTPQIGNAPFDFSYVFKQTYQDLCHPNNPSCYVGLPTGSGQTCSDCNAGYNPFYQVGAYMISFSNSPLATGVSGIKEEENFEIDLFPNPNNGIFNMDLTKDMGNVVVTVNDITGATAKTYFFKNKFELNNYQFNISDLSKGTYFIQVKTTHQASVKTVILN
ncbi:peptide-N-glycosidase F-related protein, partial [Vicingaceae bacterium]|nr:peptide-N-glycosidase F-related protein [Vicingaceae bacterium]